MAIRSTQGEQSIQIVHVDGRLDQSLTPDLESELDRLLLAGHNQLVVNLSATTYINSGGLRTLVTAWRRAKQTGGNLVLCGLNARIQEIFELVGFDKVFQIFSGVQEAQNAFK